MKPDAPPRAFAKLGAWLVLLLVAVELLEASVRALVNDWRIYAVLGAVSVGCYVATRSEAHRPGHSDIQTHERVPHDLLPHSRHRDV